MAKLDQNRWGKSAVRLSKIHRGAEADEFSELTVQVLLTGDVDAAHVEGDNTAVLPTDTMKNTIYGMAQEHLTRDIESFATVLAEHFVEKESVSSATVRIEESLWARQAPTGFTGGGSERRTASVKKDGLGTTTRGGVKGLIVLKTRGSSFLGYPQDEFTILPEAKDRLLATSVTATWLYDPLPTNTTEAWLAVRNTIVERFFGDWSASVQHQGYLMAVAVLDAVREIAEITFHLPNQHHLPFDLTRFGMEDRGVIFYPVSEPYGDIAFTVKR